MADGRDLGPGQSPPTRHLWTEIFRSFQIAFDPRKLVLAAAGIVVMAFGWWLLSSVFYELDKAPQRSDAAYQQAALEREFQNKKKPSGENYTEADLKTEGDKRYAEDRARWEVLDELAGPGGRLRTMPWYEYRGPNPFTFVTTLLASPPALWWGEVKGYLSTVAPVLIEPLVKLLLPVAKVISPGVSSLTRFYLLLVIVWNLAVWAFFGGVITRLAAVQLANKGPITFRQAIRYVAARYLNYLCAPLIPLAIIAVCVLGLIVYGVLGLIPFLGDIVVFGVGLPLVIAAGAVMAVFLVGLVGYPLMYTTLSAEGDSSDTFDALSRSINYVYQAPWQYIWYSLVAVVYGEPEPVLEEAARYLHQADALGAAEVLLGDSELDRASLERACTTARDRFVRVFAERRPVLAELQPCIEDDVVRVRCGERLLSLSAFRPELDEEIAGRRALVTDEEEQLFTSFLLDGAAGQIGEAIRRAEAWVDGINAVLARIPLVHERYVLELRQGNDLSGPLARHYALFRTSPDALSSEQRQTLLEALREATGEAQRRHEQDGVQFVQELERLLDYRAWLRLEVAVIGASGQRVVLTDRVARTRSGAEQMMAQYVPLFAALSALYDLAAPWAPRLLALDEAFDKASDESSQQMLRFLVGQGFQWLMTSPRLTGHGSAVPVYAEYLMVHERASRKAYGVPFFAETVADQSSAA